VHCDFLFKLLIKDPAVVTQVVFVKVENAKESNTADCDKDCSPQHRSKKSKVETGSKFLLDKAVSDLIKLDQQNSKLWDDVLLFVEEGHQVVTRALLIVNNLSI